MSRDAAGTYTLPASNPVVPNTTITANVWANPTLNDIAAELTNSLDRNGRGGMTGPFKIFDGTQAAPGLAFTLEPGSGLYRVGSGEVAMSITGTKVMSWIASGVIFPSPGNVTISGTLQVNGTTAALGSILRQGAAGTSRDIQGRNSDSTPRWVMELGNATAESGGNAGSDFDLFAYTDAGVGIGPALSITRATRNVTFYSNVLMGGGTTGVLNTVQTGYIWMSGGTAQIVGAQMYLFAESHPTNASEVHLRCGNANNFIVMPTINATRCITVTGSPAGNPVLGTNGGNIQINPSVVMNGGAIVLSGAAGQVVLSASASPALTFNGDVDTGIAWAADGVFDFVCNAVKQLRIGGGPGANFLVINAATNPTLTPVPGGAIAINSRTILNATVAPNIAGAAPSHYAKATAALEWSLGIEHTNATPLGIVLSYTAADPNSTGAYFLYLTALGTARGYWMSNGGVAAFTVNNVNLSDSTLKQNIEPLTPVQTAQIWDAHRDVAWCSFKFPDQTHDDPNFGYLAQDIEAKFASVMPWLVEEVEWQGYGKRKVVYGTDLDNVGHAVLSEAQRRIELLEAALDKAGITIH